MANHLISSLLHLCDITLQLVDQVKHLSLVIPVMSNALRGLSPLKVALTFLLLPIFELFLRCLSLNV